MTSVVELRLTAKPAMADALPVARALPRRERRFVGPFCFLDHFGPHAEVGRADGGVAPHPHIGLATVTYLFDGAILHRDSLGTAQRIAPGDVNWMTAGRGIVHSERTPPELVGARYTTHGLQIWVALPQAHEDDPPAFQHAPGASLPTIDLPGARLRVLLGAWDGATSPVRVWSPLTYVIAELAVGARLDVPAFQPERALYVVDGDLAIDGEPAPLASHELAVLAPEAPATLHARADAGRAVRRRAARRPAVPVVELRGQLEGPPRPGAPRLDRPALPDHRGRRRLHRVPWRVTHARATHAGCASRACWDAR